MATTRDDKLEVQRAIATHVEAHGPARWELVRQRYPDVPIATFWRWVRDIKKKPSKERMQAARDLLAVAPRSRVAIAASQMPSVSIDDVTKGAGVVAQQIDVRLELDELMADAKLLRSFSMSSDGTKVELPKIFADAAKLRIQLLEMVLAATPILSSAEVVANFFDSVVHTVAKCEPEAARQIIVKLNRFKETGGYLGANR